MKYTEYYQLKGLEVLRDENRKEAKKIIEATAEVLGEEKTKWGYEASEDWFYSNDSVDELIEGFNE